MNFLITGAASGIGKAAAEYIVEQGHTVYGIDLAPAGQSEGLHSFTADITDEAALCEIRDCFVRDGITLDVIADIAGVHMMASLVESDYSRMKKLADINLGGTMLVNRVFHSCLGERGRIVIVTSEVADFDPMPFNGLYNVTKTALESYAQALRQELNLIGQKVVTVQPGAVETPLSSSSVNATKTLAETTGLYKKQASRFSGLAAKFMGTPIAPEAVAKLIYKASTAVHPALRYRKHRNIGLVLLNVLPRRCQCAVIKMLLNM